jgi:hypothetical protein
MEGVLWYVLASSRGATRARVVRALDERPRNANQLAEELDLDYTTVRHHLDVLMDDGLGGGVDLPLYTVVRHDLDLLLEDDVQATRPAGASPTAGRCSVRTALPVGAGETETATVSDPGGSDGEDDSYDRRIDRTAGSARAPRPNDGPGGHRSAQ